MIVERAQPPLGIVLWRLLHVPIRHPLAPQECGERPDPRCGFVDATLRTRGGSPSGEAVRGAHNGRVVDVSGRDAMSAACTYRRITLGA